MFWVLIGYASCGLGTTVGDTGERAANCSRGERGRVVSMSSSPPAVRGRVLNLNLTGGKSRESMAPTLEARLLPIASSSAVLRRVVDESEDEVVELAIAADDIGNVAEDAESGTSCVVRKRYADGP